MCLESEDLCEVFDKYFASVFTKEKVRENVEFNVGNSNMLGKFDIEVVVFGLLKKQ